MDSEINFYFFDSYTRNEKLMRLQYPKWLKDLLLPFESLDHPLYADPAVMQQREMERERIQNLSPEERMEELYDPNDITDEEMMELMEAKSNLSGTSYNEIKTK